MHVDICRRWHLHMQLTVPLEHATQRPGPKPKKYVYTYRESLLISHQQFISREELMHSLDDLHI